MGKHRSGGRTGKPASRDNRDRTFLPLVFRGAAEATGNPVATPVMDAHTRAVLGWVITPPRAPGQAAAPAEPI